MYNIFYKNLQICSHEGMYFALIICPSISFSIKFYNHVPHSCISDKLFKYLLTHRQFL